MRLACSLALALAGCSLITDPGSYEGGGERDGGIDAGEDAMVDAAFDAEDPCEGACDDLAPYCVEFEGDFMCAECRTAEDCDGNAPLCFGVLCLDCDSDDDGEISADPFCDELADGGTRDCDDDGDGFFADADVCDPLAGDIVRDCVDSLDYIRPGIGVCGGEYFSCSDPVEDLDLDAFIVGGSVSVALPADLMAAPPPRPTDWALPDMMMPPPRPPFDLTIEAAGSWTVAYVQNRSGLIYDQVSLRRVTYDDGPLLVTHADDSAVPFDGGHSYRDVQILRVGDQTFMGMVWMERTQDRAVLYERNRGTWTERANIVQPEIFAPLALTVDPSARARIYVRNDGGAVTSDLRWVTASGSSDSRSYPIMNVPQGQGISIAASGERVWLNGRSGIRQLALSDCPLGCSDDYVDEASAGIPRAITLPDGRSIVSVAVGAGGGRQLRAALVNGGCGPGGTACPAPQALATVSDFVAYDFVASPTAPLLFVAHDEPADGGRAVRLAAYNPGDFGTLLGDRRLFEDLPGGDVFDSVLAIAVDLIQGEGNVEIAVAVLADPPGNGMDPPRIYLSTLRLCE